jgi:transcriptional regulator with XRE-family HTH domain
VHRSVERLRTEFTSDKARDSYADSVTNAFLNAQINALREERGFTQEKLAELVGTQQSGVSRWLNSGFATCKVETLRKFARAFRVRLRISFEEFGTLPSDVNGFTKERLTPRKFEDDPAFKENPQEESATATTAKGGLLGRLVTGELLPGDFSLPSTSSWAAKEVTERIPGGGYLQFGFWDPEVSGGTLQKLAGLGLENIGASTRPPQAIAEDEPVDPYHGIHLAPLPAGAVPTRISGNSERAPSGIGRIDPSRRWSRIARHRKRASGE